MPDGAVKSAFTLDGFTLLERQEYGMFAAYTTASVAGALLALVLGLSTVQAQEEVPFITTPHCVRRGRLPTESRQSR